MTGRRKRLEPVPPETHAPFRLHALKPAIELLLGCGVDHRTHVGSRLARVAQDEFARSAGDHRQNGFGDVLLHTEKPQRGAALARRAKRRRNNVIGDLLGQCRRVDDHWMDIIQGGMTPQAAAEKAFKRIEQIFTKYPIAAS